MPERTFTDAELDLAIEQLSDPERLRAGQDLVMRAAPALQRVLAFALAEGEYFGSAHAGAVRDAAAEADPDARLRAVRELLAEETRLAMLVGVAVGFELRGILDQGFDQGGPQPPPDRPQED